MATSRGSAASAAFSPWVTATLFLILFLVITPQVFVIAPHFLNELPYRQSDAVAALIKTLLPFNLGAIGILSNYYICITTDPGIVPKGWRPPQQVMQRCKTDKESVEKQPGESAILTDDDEYNEDDDRETDEDRQSITTSDEEDDEVQLELRYCKPCKSFKPPRAHHCRTCKRCVLRMDHHCPWIANCVGQRNYASFIRFLAFVDITCTMHLVLLCARVADWWWLRMTGGFWRTPSTFQMVFIVINFALCVPTFLFVGIFSLYHFWCLCSNTTTIEAAELDKVDRLIRRGRIRDVDYPFDLGMLRNVLSIFGRSPLRWCVPAVSQGDGLSFDVGEGLDDISQYAWPPSDPDYENRHQSRPYVDGDPFTYGHNGFNPSLQPSNQLRERVRRGSEGYEVEGRTAMMTLQDEAEDL